MKLKNSLCLLLALLCLASKPKPCAVSAPGVLLVPGQYLLHVKAHLLDPTHWWTVNLFLVAGDVALQTSQLCSEDGCQVAPHTFNKDWDIRDLEEGDYEVQLVAVNREGDRCVARQTVQITQ